MRLGKLSAKHCIRMSILIESTSGETVLLHVKRTYTRGSFLKEESGWHKALRVNSKFKSMYRLGRGGTRAEKKPTPFLIGGTYEKRGLE